MTLIIKSQVENKFLKFVFENRFEKYFYYIKVKVLLKFGMF